MRERYSDKIYVSVVALTRPDGSVIPLQLIWPDGRQWEIDRVLDVRPGVARKAGGEGMRYLCRISGQQRELWCSQGQWFVEGEDFKG